MPKWVIHQGTGHLLRSWVGMQALTWCDMTLLGVRAKDFREPKKGERDCFRCLEYETKGG